MSAPLNVRFITRKWAPAVGGMETYCTELTGHLSAHVDLEIIALPGHDNGDAPTGGQILFFGLKTVLKLMTAPAADVTHISDMASWPLALAAKLRRRQTKIILSAHGSDLSYAGRAGVLPKIYGAYMRLGARLLPGSTVLANSRWIADLASDFGFKNTRLIPLATDITPPDFPPQSTGDLFFAGRIMKSKGLSFIIENVLPRLPDSVHLRVAGTVWEDDEGDYLNRDRVDYLGRLNQSELAGEYAGAACVIVPSLTPEGFGLVAAEAAVCGAIVIAADHTGLSEVCKGGIGILVETRNANLWTDKITGVLNLPEHERAKIITRAQTEAKARYTWARVAADTLAAYR